jgi:hypothetical protein
VCLRSVCTGQYIDDKPTSQFISKQHHPNDIDSDNESESSAMFQADYQYTPLTEYAAMRNGLRIIDESKTNGYQSKSIARISYFDILRFVLFHFDFVI